MAASRYQLDPEADENTGDMPAIVCVDCPGLIINDLRAHNAWHIEREAAADPNQASLFG